MPADELASLPELPHPWEPIILRNGQWMRLKIHSWQKGTMVINPSDGSGPTRVAAIRLFATRLDKKPGAPYYDARTTQLIAAIEPFLQSPAFAFADYTLRAQGAGARLTYSVEVVPPPPPPAAERFA